MTVLSHVYENIYANYFFKLILNNALNPRKKILNEIIFLCINRKNLFRVNCLFLAWEILRKDNTMKLMEFSSCSDSAILVRGVREGNAARLWGTGNRLNSFLKRKPVKTWFLFDFFHVNCDHEREKLNLIKVDSY